MTTLPHGFANATNKHVAWIVTPAGWTLLDAEAKSDSTNDVVRVTHSCPGTSPSPSPPGESPSATPSQPGESPSATPTGVAGTTPGNEPTTPGTVPTTPGGNLPTTGTAIGGFVIAGLALIAGGVAMMAIRRRRELTETVE